MNMAYFRKQRNMEFIKRGMRVVNTFTGRAGRISSVNCSGNLNVKFDGDNFSINCHPKSMMQYFDKSGGMIAEFN
jgi:hypothetical protein